MFRSQDVELYEVHTSRESAWHVLDFFGLLDKAMIVAKHEEDQKMDKDFVNRIRSLEEWVLKLNSIVDRSKEFRVEGRTKPKDLTELGKSLKKRADKNGIKNNRVLERYLMEAEEKISNLTSYISNYENFISKLTELNNAITILKNIRHLLPKDFGEKYQNVIDQNTESKLTNSKNQAKGSLPTAQNPDLATLGGGANSLNYFAGLINTTDVLRFKRTIFRMTRGNAIMNDIALEDFESDLEFRCFEQTDDKGKKSPKSLVFIIYLGKVSNLGNKLATIAVAFNMFCLSIPSVTAQIEQQITQYSKDFNENIAVFEDTFKEVQNILSYFLESQDDTKVSRIDELIYLVEKEKKICQVISNMDVESTYSTFKFWIAKNEEQKFLNKLDDIESNDASFTKPEIRKLNYTKLAKVTPPTLFGGNEFTEPYQLIVETYGIPKFKEVNPAYFTTVSFPFEFGVMFGDIGHGFLLMLAGLFLMAKSETYKKIGGMWQGIQSLKYMFTLMGFFAMYNGFIYNDFFAVKLPLFNSCYTEDDSDPKNPIFTRKEDCVYPFGIDYVWGKTNQEVTYYNSYKMKLSIIIGVTHMLLGIAMKGVNAIHFKNPVDFIFEFVPQFIFMISLFGYMSLLIIIKWIKNWDGLCENRTSADAPECPAIINTFTNFTEVVSPIFDDKPFQQSVQSVILIIAFVCVIMMLIPKPIIVHMKNKKAHQSSHKTHDNKKKNSDEDDELKEQLVDNQDKLAKSKPTKKVEEEDADEHGHGFGELFIHQMIETIEFVLGSISNTASYLRLWALSLAHAQLAHVFLTLIMADNYQNPTNPIFNAIKMVPSFFFLSGVTLGVLMLMDMMECFLHTLRLHWVEFQNKFFKGEGLKFETFNFKNEPKDE